MLQNEPHAGQRKHFRQRRSDIVRLYIDAKKNYLDKKPQTVSNEKKQNQ